MLGEHKNADLKVSATGLYPKRGGRLTTVFLWTGRLAAAIGRGLGAEAGEG